MKFTQTTISEAVCPGGRKDALFFDDGLPGFGCRVTQAGRKHFLVQYRSPTGLRRMPLGQFGELTVEQARKAAKTALGEVAAGRDPFADRADARKAAIDADTAEKAKQPLRAVIAAWSEAHKAKRRTSYLSVASRAMERHLAGLLERKADSITAREAQSAIDRANDGAGPVAANRLLSYGRATYSWAIKARKFNLTENPFAGLQPPGHEISRDRVLTDAETGMIWRAAEKLGWPGGPFTRILLLTLARRNEISEMRWSEMSADFSIWTLPASRAKNGKAHITHLSEPVHDILKSLPRIEGVDFVFSTTHRGGISGFSSFKRQIDAAILAENGGAIPAWTFHDFRRAGVSWLAKAGFAPHVADRLLNHSGGAISGVAAIYQRHDFAVERAAALDAWAAHAVACGTDNAVAPNVVRLRA